MPPGCTNNCSLRQAAKASFYIPALPHVSIPRVTLELRPLVASVWAGRSAA